MSYLLLRITIIHLNFSIRASVCSSGGEPVIVSSPRENLAVMYKLHCTCENPIINVRISLMCVYMCEWLFLFTVLLELPVLPSLFDFELLKGFYCAQCAQRFIILVREG